MHIAFGKIEWFVGYQYELDEIFMYRFCTDGTVKVMRMGKADVICFPEFIQSDKFVELGEL